MLKMRSSRKFCKFTKKHKMSFLEASAIIEEWTRRLSAGPWAPWGVGGKNKTTGNPHAGYLTRHWADGPAKVVGKLDKREHRDPY